MNFDTASDGHGDAGGHEGATAQKKRVTRAEVIAAITRCVEHRFEPAENKHNGADAQGSNTAPKYGCAAELRAVIAELLRGI